MAVKYIVLLGPPGSGKGTQAAKIIERFGFFHVSTGDLFRKEIFSGSSLGKNVQSYLSQGQLVPDEVTIEVVENCLRQNSATNGFLLDGFPRTLAQAEAVDRFVTSVQGRLAAVLFLDISDVETVRRISSRRQCNKCSHIYSLSQPQKDSLSKCHCGGELIVRQDDRPEIVQERLNVYRVMTAPLIEYYQGQRALYRVEGEGTVDEVTKKIVRILNDAGAGTN